MVTELSGFYGLSGLDYEYTVPGYAGTSYTYRYRTGRMTAQGTFGVMRNRGPWALGASVAAVASSADDHPTVAFLRARRWLDRRTGVDLAFSPRPTHDGAWIGEAGYGTADLRAGRPRVGGAGWGLCCALESKNVGVEVTEIGGGPPPKRAGGWCRGLLTDRRGWGGGRAGRRGGRPRAGHRAREADRHVLTVSRSVFADAHGCASAKTEPREPGGGEGGTAS